MGLSDKEVPDRQGVYDNTATMCREVWHETPNGLRLVQSISHAVIAARLPFLPPLSPWGTNPHIATTKEELSHANHR